MNEKYHCNNCSYFFGKEGIHCAVHPYGKESDSCSDWQQNIKLQKEELMNTERETKYFYFSKFAWCIIPVGTALLIGYQLYQNIPLAISADKNYNVYEKGCEIFLERASLAGTTGVARVELAKGVNWLESKSLVQDFEYKDLKANLDYLQEQPGNLAMPVTITKSISSNFEKIKQEQIKLQTSSWSNLYLSILVPIVVSLLILTFTLPLEE